MSDFRGRETRAPGEMWGSDHPLHEGEIEPTHMDWTQFTVDPLSRKAKRRLRQRIFVARIKGTTRKLIGLIPGISRRAT